MATNNSGRYRRNRLKALGAFQDDLCFFCDEPVVYLEPTRKYAGRADSNEPLNASFDHYVPRSKGGAGTRENTVIAHRQCNSKKGHQPTPELDEKLARLNVRRGYGDENGTVEEDRVMRRLRYDEFSAPFPALVYMCDLANTYEGEEGNKLRDTIARRVQKHKLLLKDLGVIENMSLRWEALNSILRYRAEFDVQRKPLPEPFEELIANVCKTLARSVWRTPLSKNAKRRQNKLVRELTDEQRERVEQRDRERDAVAAGLGNRNL